MEFKILIEHRKTGVKGYCVGDGDDMQDALAKAADLFAEDMPNKIIGIEMYYGEEDQRPEVLVTTTYTNGHDVNGNPRNIQVVTRCRQNGAEMVSLTRFCHRTPHLPLNGRYNGQYVLAPKEFRALIQLAKSQGIYHETN